MSDRTRSYVVDADTGDDIVGATVYLLNADGSINKPLATTDDKAFFEFDTPPFGTKVLVSFPGYESQTVDPAYLLWQGVKLVPKPGSTLGEVVVTGVRKTIKKPGYTLPLILGTAALGLFGVWLYKTHS